MTSGSPEERRPIAPLEIPIEPLPTEPLVPRPDPSRGTVDDGVDPRTIETTPTESRTIELDPVELDATATAETIAEFETLGTGVMPEPTPAVTPPVVISEAVLDLPERDSAGRGVLRPTTPQPARDEPARVRRNPRFTDQRHPIRAALGLIALVVLGAIALAAALGLAVAAVAFAIRQTAG